MQNLHFVRFSFDQESNCGPVLLQFLSTDVNTQVTASENMKKKFLCAVCMYVRMSFSLHLDQMNTFCLNCSYYNNHFLP